MSEEILINVTPQETRVAVVENGVLQEVYIERSNNRGIVGNIYKGKVARILPGMQAAFVDIGLERAAFLHVSDIRAKDGNDDTVNGDNGDYPAINTLLHDGQEIVVHVVKDPIGTKGARLTMNLTLPARYLVYLPDTRHIGISQKIEDEEERERLRNIVKSNLGDDETGGYILRTAAETANEKDLQSDIKYLHRVWSSIEGSIGSATTPSLIHEDLPLSLRAMRDLSLDMVEKIRIDSRETFNRAVEFAHEFIPEIEAQIEYYPGERPILDLYSVEDEIQKALDRKVLLKSAGYLIIDQTEALTTIDVNTGAYVGKKNLEETIFKTNLEAAHAIARQLRLRNLGGIIIIDFIDMFDEDHKRQVLRMLEKTLARDRTKVYVSDISSLGLVELTRKRTRESLEHILCEPCPVCGGRSVLKTPQTVCYEIFRELLREARQFDAVKFTVMASQLVIDLLVDEEAASLANLQEFIGKPVHLQVEPSYHQEQFDVVLM
ncbi:MAG: ribonuclease G [Gammaproteobacteria bacterium]|nr:MAG: ribonuclease G [Gammaproteobacteria bacterium]